MKIIDMAKRNNYISVELDFAEEQLESYKKYIQDNPIDQIEDRWGKKEMPRGGHTMVVTSTREQQIKSVQDTMVKFLQMLEVIDKLREKEEAKLEARGGGNVPIRMRNRRRDEDAD